MRSWCPLWKKLLPVLDTDASRACARCACLRVLQSRGPSRARCKAASTEAGANASASCHSPAPAQNGEGKFEWGSGDVYEGAWDEESRPHGKGRYVWHDGESYEGDWDHGLKHGEGLGWLRERRAPPRTSARREGTHRIGGHAHELAAARRQ